ncbi:MAG: polyribonucleotide nucleotidyltransferase [Runella slithyformis]|nr:MAG: polyribonucleotide nucleotidyltransferase [Runella slithyformis]TAF97112.1 MAG: polyribonucleotide nucleotidyltransferase [Runella sp.]TAG21594.1 MAG: polyribonucleotide nucleotidyltransferase [Cytophagales bacterium]TAG40857.1 MAG: polyribonucleotide nucleotidyltransferase [Cytophagia bacterium]TAF01135.1 MAG: polyribonucleotide nucleotidyltransferase [Runella slithyformis]
MFNIITKTITLPDGRTITIETGKLARQADGAVVVRMGNTMLLATVVSNPEPKLGIDFLPLSVDYQEKFASAGRIPGSFQKREGRLSDHEILVSRLVDRALRPMFPEDFHSDTQVNIFLISADAEVLPDALAALAASAALMITDVPFGGPISEVRVAKINGQYLINPPTSLLKEASLDLIVAASAKDICMVEGEMNEASEQEVVEALKVAHEVIKMQCAVQKELEAACGKTEKRTFEHVTHDEALREQVRVACYDKIYAVAQQGSDNKNVRKDGFKGVLKAYLEQLKAENPETAINEGLVKRYYHDLEWEASRRLVLDERKRLDSRQLDQIRPIACEVDFLPNPHGSALFTRGETQSLTTVTLGTKLDEQIIDTTMYYGMNRFMLHYNFPGFSTGEVKPNRGPGRREIGHGNLAHRSIKKILPADADNPYTIRIVSDILESNGSSSMATVCAGTLALMDAGIKIKAPVAGIAMGLITDNTGKYAVLSDILGDEDHLGDMDFKVTGTEKGITACQMDMKVDGLSYDVLVEALDQARRGRLHILGEMKKAIAATRDDLKPHAPRAVTIKIPQDQIGAIIGPGGKIVQEIQRSSGATVNIEEKENAGFVTIFATNKESMDKAIGRVKGIVAIPEEGETYEGVVKTIQPFGAFVEFMPGKDGLLHISEIKWERLETMDGILQVGETIKVKLVEVDKKTGKYRLSAKALLPRPEGMPEPQPRREREGGGERRDDRNRGDRPEGNRNRY